MNSTTLLGTGRAGDEIFSTSFEDALIACRLACLLVLPPGASIRSLSGAEIQFPGPGEPIPMLSVIGVAEL